MTSSGGDSADAASLLTRRAMQAFGFLLGSGKNGVAVAVSGGSDSMALLMLATEFREQTGVRVSAVTVDHGLRPEARDEARQVGRVCKALNVPHHVLRWQRTSGGQVGQDEARAARHRLLGDWAQQHGCDRIALGHTRDDRLETFLLRARQGSGWYGLGGLLPDSPSPAWPEGRDLMLLRPLLAFGREELRDELRARGVHWVEDPSNAAGRFERVRMRRLLARMDSHALRKAMKVMDRLLELRAAVARRASELVAHLQVDADAGEASLPLDLRSQVGNQAWLRFVEAMVMAAGGAPHPPRRDALERLLTRIELRDPQLAGGATLAGAKLRIRKSAILAFSEAPPRQTRSGGTRPDWARAASLLHPPDLRALSV